MLHEPHLRLRPQLVKLLPCQKMTSTIRTTTPHLGQRIHRRGHLRRGHLRRGRLRQGYLLLDLLLEIIRPMKTSTRSHPHLKDPWERRRYRHYNRLPSELLRLPRLRLHNLHLPHRIPLPRPCHCQVRLQPSRHVCLERLDGALCSRVAAQWIPVAPR